METFKENLIKKIGKQGLAKIEAAKIGLAGAGGLGSNCALNLVRAGFRQLTIIDFDVVTPANLDRQFYFLAQVGRPKVEALRENLLRVNPELELNLSTERIEKANIAQLFKECKIVAECLDKAEYKSMLVAELLPLGKFIISVSGVGGIGNSDEIKVHRIRDNLIMIGDLKSDICKKPPISPRVNVTAAKQADIILDYVLNSPFG
jgi:sulfur carrier protein ThiS adenylyltransferase